MPDRTCLGSHAPRTSGATPTRLADRRLAAGHTSTPGTATSLRPRPGRSRPHLRHGSRLARLHPTRPDLTEPCLVEWARQAYR